MYIIKHKYCDILVDGRQRSGYFCGFEEHGLREYDCRERAMRFRSRAEAEAFLREKLAPRGNMDKHEIVRG